MSDEATITRGMVVWGPAIVEDKQRPFLIVSTDDLPFDDDYIGLAVTRSGFEDAIPLDDEDWIIGGLPSESYVKPWNPATLKPEWVTHVAGAVNDAVVNRSVRELAGFCGIGAAELP